ncbi:MAG: ABC transporter substrate-binding protein [Planctomycetota bacterium]|jgi:ABC-type transport system substrate-binding protein
MLGTTLQDRYVLNAELGRGGMGVVYRAHDPVLDRDVAVKVIPPTHVSPETEERFRREAQLVAQMDHPGIVPVYDFGSHEDSLFLVMPVVPGTSLRPFLEDRSLLLGDVLDVGIAVAEALDYSHSRGVVHRDIKPENTMIERDGSGRLRTRVMDFGLARVSTKTRITQTGMLVGTMSYVSPEQITSIEADHRCDIYSLGTMLYECLAGRTPFAGEMQSVLYRIVHELPQGLRDSGVDVDEELDQLILQCLAKDPAERPQSAGAVAQTLRRVAERMRESDRHRSVMLRGTGTAVRPAVAPFVGRKKEVAAVQARLNAAVAGECQLVLLGGEPGSGKSRILDELENLANARHLRVLHGRFIEQQSFPYQGFCEAIQEYFRRKETGHSSSTALADFSDLAPDLVALFPMLAEIEDIRTLSSTAARPTDSAVVQPENRTQVFELLARALTRIAGGKPLVLLLEDLHGADVSVEALQYIIPRLGPTPTLVVATYRTNEIDRHHPVSRLLDAFDGDRHFESIELGPFNGSEHRLFLETLVGASDLAEDLVDRLYERTEGNPFFTKELVRSLLDSEAIGKDETGTWGLTGQAQLRSETLPATIQQAVEKRVKRLSAEHRDILSVAAVLGKTFDFRDLEDLASSKGDVDEAVEELVQEGLLEEVPGARADLLAFGSGMVKDALYEALSRRKRRSLHRKCAEQIEKRNQGRLERVYPELVYHYSEGDVPEKTVEYGLAHARSSLRTFSPEEAIRALRKASEFLEDEWEGDPAEVGAEHLIMARAQAMAGDAETALSEAEEAADLFERIEKPELAAEALVFAAEQAWRGRLTEETGRFVKRGTAASRSSGSHDLLQQCLAMGATLANLRGEYDRADQLMRESASLDAEPQAEDEVPSGGTLVVPLANAVRSDIPVDCEFDEETEVLTNVFETIASTDESGNPVPQLADSWEVLDEGRSLLVHLRDGVRFQDGHPLQAVDLKASIEESLRRAKEQPPAAYQVIEGYSDYLATEAGELSGLVVRGERDLEFKLSDALPIYPALLTDARTAIMRSREDGSAVGTGPFRLAAHDDKCLRLERHEDYWRGDAARLDAIEFRPSLEARTIAEGFRHGEFDLGVNLLAEDLDLMMRDARFRGSVVEAPKKNTYLVMFNTRTGPLKNKPEVYRALAGMVRSADLVWQTLGQFGQPAATLIPPGILGHDPGKRRTPLKPGEVKQVLQDAGVETPLKLKASIHPIIADQYSALVDALRVLWAEVGVEFENATESASSFMESYNDPSGLDFSMSRWIADYDDPDCYVRSLFHTRVGLWRNFYASEELDDLSDQGRAESRPSAREALYRRMDSLICQEAGIVPLFHEVEYRLVGPRVRGMRLQGSAPYVNYASVGRAEVEKSAPAEPVAHRGSVQVPLGGSVEAIAPWSMTVAEQFEVAFSVFECLTRHEKGARIVPGLADEFHAESGGARYRFRLRDDVRFHDGRRLTARDVRYTFEQLLLRWDYRSLIAPIVGSQEFIRSGGELEGFRIVSAREFTIDLDKPVAFFPVVLSHIGVGVVPEGADLAGRSWQDGLVGTGPFRVVDFEPGKRLQLERNPKYWKPERPRCERLEFEFGVPPAEIHTGFLAGRYTLCTDLFPEDADRLRRDSKYASGYRESPSLSTYYVAFNTHSGEFADPIIRRLVARSVNVPRIVRQTLRGVAVPAHGLIPPGLLGYDPSYSREPRTPRSGRTLAGVKLKTAIHPLFMGKYSAVRDRFLEVLADLGAEVEQVNEGIADYLHAADNRTVDFILGRWLGDFADTDSFVHGGLNSREGGFGRLSGTEEVDALAERGRAESDPGTRHSLYRQIEEIIARDALLIPLFHEQVYRFAQPNLDGLTVSFGAPTVDYANLRVRD